MNRYDPKYHQIGHEEVIFAIAVIVGFIMTVVLA